MSTGLLDLYTARLPNTHVALTLGCAGPRGDLAGLPEYTKLTITSGKHKLTVTAQVLEGRECFADFIEMNRTVSSALKLMPGRRYAYVYRAADATLIVQPAPVSTVIAKVQSQTNRNALIGYTLLAQLGIPEKRGFPVQIRCGQQKLRLPLRIPFNLSDPYLRLPAAWLRMCGIAPGKLYQLQYDQKVGVLTVLRMPR